MTHAAERAFADLLSAGIVGQDVFLEPDGAGGDFVFACNLPVPHPNGEALPALASMRVRIPAQFPESKVEFVPISPEVDGFAHQDARTRALCLRVEEYPHEPSARLRAYVESAVEWLADAANGTLLMDGQPWELPDFRVRRKVRPPEVLPIENANTFAAWAGRVGQFGGVQFAAHSHGCGLVPIRFVRGQETVLEPAVGQGYIDRHGSALGTWILLPTHIVHRHRPARSFRELMVLSSGVGVDIWGLLRRTIRTTAYRGYHFLLVGAPIPSVVGGPLVRVHWQPIALAAADIESFRNGRTEGALRARLIGALVDQAVPWGEATTYSDERARARGSLSMETRQMRICVLGCGAVGGLVADHLARGGCADLALFDNETLELENLSRHSLGPVEVGQNKAAALASRLNGIHPDAHVRGFAFALPPRAVPLRADRPAWDVLMRADVLIDCTANDSVFSWASRHGRSNGKQVLHLFLNAHARMLTVCASGRHASCSRVAQCLFEDIGAGRTCFTWDEYALTGEEIEPGPGCWHATFPALGSDIAALVAPSIRMIDRQVSQPSSSRGFAAVLRRNDVPQAPTLAESLPEAMIETLWLKQYR
jgi:hypothetical protein